jgi:hypothetical protein
MRRQAFEGLPAALGRPALDGSAVNLLDTRRAEPASARRASPEPATERNTQQRAAPAGDEAEGTGFSPGQLIDMRVFAAAICFILLVLFFLRRRAVKRQRARRLARQRRLVEMRRRRMIDVVEPRDRIGHVRVVPLAERTAGTRRRAVSSR